jgi:hypothetical protein
MPTRSSFRPPDKTDVPNRIVVIYDVWGIAGFVFMIALLVALAIFRLVSSS